MISETSARYSPRRGKLERSPALDLLPQPGPRLRAALAAGQANARAALPLILLLGLQTGFSIVAGAAAGVERYDSELSSTRFEDFPLAQTIARLGSFACFAYVVPLIVYRLFIDRQGIGAAASRRTQWLWVSFVAYWGVQSTRIMLNGIDPAWLFRCALPVAFALALYLSRDVSYGHIYRWVQGLVWSVSFVTAGLLVVAPSLVATSYQGVLSFFPLRLHGLFCHANNLSYLIVIYWLLPTPLDDRQRSSRLTILANLVTVAVFVLAQSKTMYLLAVLGLAIRIMMPVIWRSRPNVRALTLLGLGATLVVGGIFSAEIIDLLFGQTQVSANDITTLTGRKIIWEQMLADWRQHPWFGYGFDRWLEALYTVRVDHWVTPNAHSQWIQTLWEAGVVGLTALVLHFAALLYCVWRLPIHYRSGMVAILAVMLIRAYSEALLSIFMVLEIQMVIHLLVFLSVCALNYETENNELLVSLAQQPLKPPRSEIRRRHMPQYSRGNTAAATPAAEASRVATR